MTHDPDDTPAARFERYLANVEERPRYQPKPARWWHFALVDVIPATLVGLPIFAVGRIFRAW